MPVYVEIQPPGRWFGKKTRVRSTVSKAQNQSPSVTELIHRLEAAIQAIDANGEIDDEMRHALLSQAYTYGEFIDEVALGNINGGTAPVQEALGSIVSFCKLVEDELT